MSAPTSGHLLCGAGGDSKGFANAGFDVAVGANHWDRAIETHAANFPDAEHLCVDLDHYDMRKLPKTDVLVGSPICYEGSPADGVARPKAPPTPGQLDLLEQGPIAHAAWERTRATAYDILRAAEIHDYKAIVCENVVRFATAWPLFPWWLTGFEQLGYRHQVVSANAAHVGDPGNDPASQWRDRIFIVFTKLAMDAPDLRLSPRAWCPTCGVDVDAVQAWRNGRKIGKYRQQYDYRCPNSACRHQVVEPYVSPAAAVIDWTDLGTRIGDRPTLGMRPLAANTVKKIRLGLDRYRTPTVVTVNHDDRGGDGRAFPAAGSPLPTRTLRIGDGVAVPPLLVPTGGSWNDSAVPVTVPMRTRTTRESEGVLIPGAFITEHRGGGSTTRPVADPLATITAGGNHHGLVIPYRKGKPTTTADPLHTIATHESAALAGAGADLAALELEECRFRMLSPREHLRAQRFTDDYIVKGNVGEQTAQAGNAVPCNVAQWIASKLLEVL
ncbi:DNA (cytosine-5)-methyltransferase 1 [Streptomyces sp. 846.5]|nr:DNA cytosine methyltransferase [Streptomyces sp. 846.5]TDU05229.1 DNA (cytosine-5)-methyltransferase 1 [Streptomyces sp. 846.5]